MALSGSNNPYQADIRRVVRTQLLLQAVMGLVGFLLVASVWHWHSGVAYLSGVLASMLGSAAYGWRYLRFDRPQPANQALFHLVAAALLKWGLALAMLIVAMRAMPEGAAAIVVGFGLALLTALFAAARSG